jgi:hypothetical protein
LKPLTKTLLAGTAAVALLAAAAPRPAQAWTTAQELYVHMLLTYPDGSVSTARIRHIYESGSAVSQCHNAAERYYRLTSFDGGSVSEVKTECLTESIP